MERSPLLKFRFLIMLMSVFVIIENTPIKESITPNIWNLFDFSIFKIDEISQSYSSNLELILKPDTLDIELMVERALFKISGCSFSAVPNDIINERSMIVLPDLVLEGKNIALDIKKDENDIPGINKYKKDI